MGRPHQDRARKRPRRTSSARTWSAGSPRVSRERSPQAIARMTEMFLASNLERLYRLRAKPCATWTSRESNPRITAPTLVIVGKQDPARRRPPASDRQDRSRAPSWSRSMPRISPTSSSRRLSPRLSLNFLHYRGYGHGRERTPRARAWRSAARCWAMPGSIAPMRKKPRSMRNSRISSRARPGARSGRGRITTSAPAASW